jgi:hypothetical protein
MEIIVPAIKAAKDAQPMTRRPLCSHRRDIGEVALAFAFGEQQAMENFGLALQENGFQIAEFDGHRLALEHWNGVQAVRIERGLTDTYFKRLAVDGWPKCTTAGEEVEETQIENCSDEGEEAANGEGQVENGSEEDEEVMNDEEGANEVEIEHQNEEGEGPANDKDDENGEAMQDQ